LSTERIVMSVQSVFLKCAGIVTINLFVSIVYLH